MTCHRFVFQSGLSDETVSLHVGLNKKAAIPARPDRNPNFLVIRLSKTSSIFAAAVVWICATPLLAAELPPEVPLWKKPPAEHRILYDFEERVRSP